MYNKIFPVVFREELIENLRQLGIGFIPMQYIDAT